MQLAPDITAMVDDLLRTDARLSAAAPLLGQVVALETDPKPPSTRKPKRGRKPPPRGDAPPEESEDEAPARPSGPPPWLKIARAKAVPPDMRAVVGDRALAVVVVDGWLWGRADAQTRRAALVLALRGLRHEERQSDAADLCRREAPPLQTWPDTVDELSHLVAALTDDPAAAAGDSAAAERMAAAVERWSPARVRVLLDGVEVTGSGADDLVVAPANDEEVA